MRTLDAAAPIAEHQLGLVTRQQLLAAGVLPDTADEAVRTGRLRRLERNVYRLPGAPERPATRLLAKVLALGDGALLSHATAAWLWDLAPPPRRYEVTVPRGRRRRCTDLIVHESTDLHLAVPGIVDGLPVTGVGRTILDCAGHSSTDVELLVDEARRQHGISRTLLPATLLAHARPGRSGIDRLRSVLATDELPASDFERLFVRWLIAQRVSGWELHHRIAVPGFGPVELDVAWPAQRVALELEGADHWDRRLVHDHDTVRQNALALAGWTILRLTYRRWLQEPTQVLGEIGALLERLQA